MTRLGRLLVGGSCPRPHTAARLRRFAVGSVAIAAAAALVTAGGIAGATGKGSDGSSGGHLVNTTPPGKKPVSKVVWATYRTVDSLDPIFALDYPENTAISLACESLLRQAPTGKITPGLAKLSTPSPTTLVFTIRPGTKFWDGHPVTATDVVYSLDRASSPTVGGYYSTAFSRVQSISATGPRTVTIKLKQPDYWLPGILSGMGGVVIEKAFAEKEGKNYGTPTGSIMCTGAYEFKSWAPGVGVTFVANPHYWQPGVKPLVKSIEIKGEPTTSSLTSALLANNIQGTYTWALSTLTRLRSSNAVKVYQGPSGQTDALVVSTLHGTLGSLKVRQALSLALNRKGIIKALYHGAALLPRWFSNPGSFGYGKSVFQKAYAKAPVLRQTLAKAKKLIKQAHATGKTVTIGMSQQLSNLALEAAAYKAAGAAIGLKVDYKSLSAQNYINFFITKKARQGVTGFFTTTYGTYADPASTLATFDLPHADLNFDTFNNPKLTSLLNQARSTANPTARARLVVKAEQLTMKELPRIPNVQPINLLILNSHLSGAVASFSYMGAPWANRLGGRG